MPVERHRAAEQPLARLRVLEQALAQRLGAHVRDVELDRVDVRAVGVEREHRALEEAAADGLGDVVQLVVARRGRRRSGASARTSARREEHAVEQLGAARLAAAVVDDALDPVGEALQAVVEARVIGSVISAVLLVAKISASSRAAGGSGRGDREHGERHERGTDHRGGSFRCSPPARRRGARGRGAGGS